MLISSLVVCLRVSSISLQLDGPNWVVKEGAKIERIPVSARVAPLKGIQYQQGDRYAVWDGRGLSVRFGSKVISTRLPDFPTHPKFFSKAEIRETLALMKKGVRIQHAMALSGSCVIGSRAYFLVRWCEKGKDSGWAECLAEVDFNGKAPGVRLVQRILGTSIATEPIEDRLVPLGDKLGVVCRNGEDWGLATIAPSSGLSVFFPLGKGLVNYRRLYGNVIAFQERTPWGSNAVGRVELSTRSRRDLMETERAAFVLPGTDPLYAVLREGKERWLRALETGAEVAIPWDVRVWIGKSGIIVGSPADKPHSAQLLDPDELQPIADWHWQKTVSY